MASGLISRISFWWSDRHRCRLISSARSLVDCLNTVESLVTEGKVSREEADQIHGAIMLALDEDILPRAVEQGFVREVIQVISGINPTDPGKGKFSDPSWIREQ